MCLVRCPGMMEGKQIMLAPWPKSWALHSQVIKAWPLTGHAGGDFFYMPRSSHFVSETVMLRCGVTQDSCCQVTLCQHKKT